MTSTGLLLQQAAASLLVYQPLMQHPIGQSWLEVVRAIAAVEAGIALPEGDLSVRMAYGQLFSRLADEQYAWSEWLLRSLLVTENAFSHAAARRSLETLPLPLVQATRQDLRFLQVLWRGEAELYAAVQSILQQSVAIWLPNLCESKCEPKSEVECFLAASTDWGDGLEVLAAHYRKCGIGLFGRWRAARWQVGQLQAVAETDAIAMEQIYGCDRQKALLCQNTEALLARQPALNVLLYGARGTGKSSLVKSLLQRYGEAGLRLVEVSRADLQDLLAVVSRLAELPQSFVVFVDDLSFDADETEFKQLKVVLEGDIAAQPDNVRVYATSNRRHLIQEFFTDRPKAANEEVHAWDTVQEKLSLSDRFGLTLTFAPFSQSDYLATVEHLARVFAVELASDELRRQALIWAQQQNGFSGRTARQFVNWLRVLAGRSDRNTKN
jgi:hypothetical protein